MHIAELAVAAALLLVTPMLLDAPADGLLVVDGRAVRLDREPVFQLQTVDRHLQMDLSLPPQDQLMGVLAVLERQRWIFFDQLVQRRRRFTRRLGYLDVDGANLMFTSRSANATLPPGLPEAESTWPVATASMRPSPTTSPLAAVVCLPSSCPFIR